MANRLGLLPISADKLRDLLGLPATSKIVGIFSEELRVNGDFLLKIEDESLAELMDGHLMPRIEAEFERVLIEAKPKFKKYF